MKYPIFIFCFYMTLLTLMPCQDMEDISKSSENITAINKTSTGGEHDTHEACPPFCTCGCCSVSKHFPIVKDQVEIVQTVTIPYTMYRMPAIAEQAVEIYQPPRIA